jgi:hypothetical protein
MGMPALFILLPCSGSWADMGKCSYLETPHARDAQGEDLQNQMILGF